MPGDDGLLPLDKFTTEFQVQVEHVRIQREMLLLYERRTLVFERIAMALEHDNEKKWHSVR